MNKRVFLLILILLFLLLIISAKSYFKTKHEVLNEYNYYLGLKKKIEEIMYLKNKYKTNISYFKNFKKCSVSNKDEIYTIKCLKLNKNEFNLIQNIIFRKNFKIKSFDIEKNKTISLSVEINK